MLDKIIKDLADNYKDTDRDVLKNILDRITTVALTISNRDYNNIQPLLFYIENTTKALYLKRGAEGMTSSNYNGEANSFEDVIEKMKNEIISAGLRLPF